MNFQRVEPFAIREYEFWQQERENRKKVYQEENRRQRQFVKSPAKVRKKQIPPVELRNRSCECSECGNNPTKLQQRARVGMHRKLKMRKLFRSAVWAVVAVLAYKFHQLHEAQKRKKLRNRRSTANNHQFISLVIDINKDQKQETKLKRKTTGYLPQLVQTPSPIKEEVKQESTPFKLKLERPVIKYIDSFVQKKQSRKIIQRKSEQIHSISLNSSPTKKNRFLWTSSQEQNSEIKNQTSKTQFGSERRSSNFITKFQNYASIADLRHELNKRRESKNFMIRLNTQTK